MSARLDGVSDDQITDAHGPFVTVNGTKYQMLVPMVIQSRGYNEGTTWDAGIKVAANECSHCGRFDMVPDVAHSWDEVVARGWARVL